MSKYTVSIDTKGEVASIYLHDVHPNDVVEWMGVITASGENAIVDLNGWAAVTYRVNNGPWQLVAIDRHRSMHKASKQGFSFGV